MLLQQVNKKFHEAVRKFDSIYPHYEKATGKERERMSLELGSIFIKYKQQAVRFLYQYPGAFVNTSVVFHAFPGQLYVFRTQRMPYCFVWYMIPYIGIILFHHILWPSETGMKVWKKP